MTAEKLITPSAPQERDIKTPEGFLLELFDRTKFLIEHERNAEVVKAFEPQEDTHWVNYSRYMASVSEPMYLEKGLIFRSNSFIYGLAYGKRGNHIVRGERELSLEFGVSKVDGRQLDLDVTWLKILTNLYPGSGRIYYDTNHGKIRNDCWSDAYEFGGQEMRRWEQYRVLSEAGLEVGVDLFRQIAQRSWH